MKSYKPHDYQKFAIAKVKENPRFALFMDMGLGKTSVSLSAIDYLINESQEINKVLIFAPLHVSRFTWTEEVRNFIEFSKLRISRVVGSAAQREQALNTPADIYIVNRENTEWIQRYYVREKRWPFQMIIIDESTSYKNPNTKRFKAIKLMARHVPRVLALTATPIPRGLEDLWAQIYLLDEGERLGTLDDYRRYFFQMNGYDRELRPGADKVIHDLISDISVSMKAVDHLKMPKRIDNNIVIELPPAARRKYDEMAKAYVTTLDDESVKAKGAAAVQQKLLQMANGAVYDGNKDKTWKLVHNTKLDALAELIEIHEDRPIMILYAFEHDFERLMARFKKYNPRTLKTEKDKRDWDEGKIRILLAHPASTGHGINLQGGGSFIVWFGLTNNLEHYIQANGRLYRQGQNDTVIINHLIAKDTAEEDVIESLTKKNQSQKALLKAVKARINKIKGEN